MVFIPDQHYLWDFWLVSPQEWRDQSGLYHLFYLQAPRALRNPDLRHDRATVGHAVSSDLRYWYQQGTALEAGVPGSWDDRAIWTGSVVIRGEQAYLFYTALSTGDSAPIQRIGLAISPNLHYWQRYMDNPLLEGDARWYEPQSPVPGRLQTWRDPCVVYASDEQVYYMFFAARANEGSHDARGVIGLARSTDLLTWETLPPVNIPGDYAEMEVPQVVALDSRYYLLFCTGKHAAAPVFSPGTKDWVGTHYLVADTLTGPYRQLTDEPLLADAVGTYYAGKLLFDRTGAPCFIAWRQWDQEDTFCGGLSNPAEVQVLSDGRLRIQPQQLWTG